MKRDDLMAALERLLEPGERDEAAAEAVVPYWAARPDVATDAQAGAFGPDAAAFLSDGLADPTAARRPSLADMAAYVDGMLSGADLEAFEAALVASPDLRAETDMLSRHAALFGADANADRHREPDAPDGA